MELSKNLNDKPIVIVGAGPTGIGTAKRLQELGINNWLLLERENHPGGLAASFVHDGFLWDIGGHVIFSHYDAYDKLLEEAIPPEHWLFYPRNAQVRIDDRWISYPFQLNLDELKSKQRRWCRESLDHAKQQSTNRSSFSTYIDTHFGEGIAALFMRPYNQKIWACHLEQMSTKWIGERVAPIRQAPTQDEKSDKWGPNRDFRYPMAGGTGAIWHAAAMKLDQDNLLLDTEVTAIDMHDHRLSTSTGGSIEYSALVNTMPIDRLCTIAAVSGLEHEISQLVHTSVHVIGLGLKGDIPEAISDVCWMYFPDQTCPFYRATILSRYSPNNAPKGNWSLMLEVSESEYRPVTEALVDECIKSCLDLSLIDSPSAIVHKWHYRAEYGYPVPTLSRDDSLQAINHVLEPNDIYSRGRFGAWKYEVGNMDHSYMQGREVADRLVLGHEETVINC